MGLSITWMFVLKLRSDKELKSVAVVTPVTNIPWAVKNPTVVIPDVTLIPPPNVAIPINVDIPLTFKFRRVKSSSSVIFLPLNSFA